MKPMMATFAHPVTPRRTSYVSIDRHWRQWGWSVSWHRGREQDFSWLRHATTRGFRVGGTGVGTVVPPSTSRPGQRLRVTMHGDTGDHSAVLHADVDGRLHVEVP